MLCGVGVVDSMYVAMGRRAVLRPASLALCRVSLYVERKPVGISTDQVAYTIPC